MFVTLKYCQAVVFTGGAATNLAQFRATSLFAPSLTLSGHQPFLFDQYAALYDRYMVYGSSINIQCMSDASSVVQASVWPATDNSAPTPTVELARELPYSRSVLLPDGPVGGNSKVLNSVRMTTKRMRGGAVLDDQWGALTTASPTRQWFWNLFAGTLNGSASSASSYMVTIYYRCRFHKRVNQGPS